MLPNIALLTIARRPPGAKTAPRDDQRFGLMRQPIQPRRGQQRVAEQIRPFGRRAVTGHQDAAQLVALVTALSILRGSSLITSNRQPKHQACASTIVCQSSLLGNHLLLTLRRCQERPGDLLQVCARHARRPTKVHGNENRQTGPFHIMSVFCQILMPPLARDGEISAREEQCVAVVQGDLDVLGPRKGGFLWSKTRGLTNGPMCR